MKNFLKKLTSRKFIAATAGVVSGLAIAFGLEQDIITAVAGAVTSLISVIAYIVTEGRVDAAAVGAAAEKAAQAAQDLLDMREDEKSGDSI